MEEKRLHGLGIRIRNDLSKCDFTWVVHIFFKYNYNANRLATVEGVAYTWDNNGRDLCISEQGERGNLLSDGISTYTYNHSNQLTGVSQGGVNYSYAYNGLGERLRQTAGTTTTNYVIDSSSGLSQVLTDGTNTYLYGLERISQANTGGKDYFFSDALGSVRQMANTSGTVTLSRNYEPYGAIYGAMGNGITAYGFTSEWTDGTGLVNLRARYYAPTQGRFVSQDMWGGNRMIPATTNRWLYVSGNPLNQIDPSGLFSRQQIAKSFGMSSFDQVLSSYDQNGEHWGFLASLLRALPGDNLVTSSLDILPIGGKPGLSSKTSQFTFNETDGILTNGQSLRYSYSLHTSIDKHYHPFIWWRSQEASYYTIKSTSDYKTYIDGSMTTDLPDYWAVSVSGSGEVFGIQGLFITDRFGNQYISAVFNSGLSLPIDFSYSEGYVGVPVQSGNKHIIETLLPEPNLFNKLNGLGICLGGQGSIGAGISGGSCMYSQSYFVNFSTGMQAGFEGSFQPYTQFIGKNNSMRWDWAIQDRFHGTQRNDLTKIQEIPFDSCTQYSPLYLR